MQRFIPKQLLSSVSLLGAMLCFFAPSAHAFTTILQADVAQKGVDHTFHDTLGYDANFSGDTVAGVLGLAFIGKQFYLNLSGELPWKDAHDFLYEAQTYMDLTRKDYALTLGYNLPQGWSVFGGYKYGKTTVDLTSYESVTTTGVTLATFDVKEEGLYLGASYAFQVSPGNSLSLSAAYAVMQGELVNHRDPAGGGGTGPANADGDVTGYSLSAKWIHEISPQTTLNIALKLNSYNNEMKQPSDGARVEFDSDYTYATIGLSHVF